MRSTRPARCRALIKMGARSARIRRFAQRYPRSKRAPEARFLAAWLEIRLGRANGEKQMERLVRGKSQVRRTMASLGGLGARLSRLRDAPLRPGGSLPLAVHQARQHLDGRGARLLLARTRLPAGTESGRRVLARPSRSSRFIGTPFWLLAG